MQDKVPGAAKLGDTWIIPSDLERPKMQIQRDEQKTTKAVEHGSAYKDAIYRMTMDSFPNFNATTTTIGDIKDIPVEFYRVNANYFSGDPEENRLDGRDISIELREEDLDEWKRQMAISVDTVPFEQIGFGSQNSIKVELAIDNSAENV